MELSLIIVHIVVSIIYDTEEPNFIKITLDADF
jgi:hypothetical protein